MSKIQFEVPDYSNSPVGGWKYKHPISGVEFAHYSYLTIERQVIQHNKGNGYPMPNDWPEVFRDEMCKQNGWGKETCRSIQGGRLARSAVLFGAVMAYGKVLAAFLKSGGQYVDQEEAERRALICRHCPMNGPANWGCGSCSQSVHTLVEKIKGKRSTKQDNDLEFCGICNCSLKASVHYPLEAQKEGITPEMREQFQQIPDCWKKEA